MAENRRHFGGFVSFFVRSTLLIVPVFCCAAAVWAQSAANSGEIVGQVTDASSAAVSGARIIVRNQSTNFTRGTTTDAAGRYALTSVPLGPYEVQAQAAGMETTSQQ